MFNQYPLKWSMRQCIQPVDSRAYTIGLNPAQLQIRPLILDIVTELELNRQCDRKKGISRKNTLIFFQYSSCFNGIVINSTDVQYKCEARTKAPFVFLKILTQKVATKKWPKILLFEKFGLTSMSHHFVYPIILYHTFSNIVQLFTGKLCKTNTSNLWSTSNIKRITKLLQLLNFTLWKLDEPKDYNF